MCAIVVFGATGMVGAGALHASLADPRVTSVLTVGRAVTGRTHPNEPRVPRLRRVSLLPWRVVSRNERRRLQAPDPRPHAVGGTRAGVGQSAHDLLLRVRCRHRQQRPGTRDVGSREGPARRPAGTTRSTRCRRPSIPCCLPLRRASPRPPPRWDERWYRPPSAGAPTPLLVPWKRDALQKARSGRPGSPGGRSEHIWHM